ncbi:MAG: hypothetical protein Q4A01_01205 [Coriobacteriales bacterium]|nr:hypothetical protein [Coriobacteriales bacterium]
MLLSSKRFVVAAGLTSILALGCFGCSTKTTVTTDDGKTETTTTTTTDDGKTESTTTTTTTDDGKTETTTTDDTTDLASMTYYEIAAVGFRYDLPEGFTFSKAETDLASNKDGVTAFMAVNDKKDNFNLIVSQSEDTLDVSSKEFLDAAIEAGTSALEGKGGKVNKATSGTIQVKGKTLPEITYEAELDGGTSVVVKQAFYVGKIDDSTYVNLTFTATGHDAAIDDTMFEGVSFTS